MDNETRRTWTPRPVSLVYLTGDASPVYVDLTPDALVSRLTENAAFAADLDADFGAFFVRLPLMGRNREALIRPNQIAAILPATYDPDREEDDDA